MMKPTACGKFTGVLPKVSFEVVPTMKWSKSGMNTARLKVSNMELRSVIAALIFTSISESC